MILIAVVKIIRSVNYVLSEPHLHCHEMITSLVATGTEIGSSVHFLVCNDFSDLPISPMRYLRAVKIDFNLLLPEQK